MGCFCESTCSADSTWESDQQVVGQRWQIDLSEGEGPGAQSAAGRNWPLCCGSGTESSTLRSTGALPASGPTRDGAQPPCAECRAPYVQGGSMGAGWRRTQLILEHEEDSAIVAATRRALFWPAKACTSCNCRPTQPGTQRYRSRLRHREASRLPEPNYSTPEELLVTVRHALRRYQFWERHK